MGLLESVLGAALGGGQQQNNQGGLGGMLAGMLGGGGNGGNANNANGGGGGMNMAALIPMLAPLVINMLSNNGPHGGLGGLTDKFNQAGLGDAMNSWVGNGENQAVSGEQVTQALGTDTISQIANQLGLGHGDTAGALAQMLPGIINHLTPNGQAPAGGLGNSGDLMGMLGGLLQQR
jgi:uncharacterized protein YidB (DUF937 family)